MLQFLKRLLGFDKSTEAKLRKAFADFNKQLEPLEKKQSELNSSIPKNQQKIKAQEAEADYCQQKIISLLQQVQDGSLPLKLAEQLLSGTTIVRDIALKNLYAQRNEHAAQEQEIKEVADRIQIIKNKMATFFSAHEDFLKKISASSQPNKPILKEMADIPYSALARLEKMQASTENKQTIAPIEERKTEAFAQKVYAQIDECIKTLAKLKAAQIRNKHNLALDKEAFENSEKLRERYEAKLLDQAIYDSSVADLEAQINTLKRSLSDWNQEQRKGSAQPTHTASNKIDRTVPADKNGTLEMLQRMQEKLPKKLDDKD